MVGSSRSWLSAGASFTLLACASGTMRQDDPADDRATSGEAAPAPNDAPALAADTGVDMGSQTAMAGSDQAEPMEPTPVESPGAAGSGPRVGTPITGLTPPDPDVTFEWTASLPGGDDDCRPGHYTGTFSCDYRIAPTDPDPSAVVTGPVTLTLERSQDGEFLEIADGQLDGIASLVFGFRSQLSGKLDCRTRELTATAVDGVWGFGDPAALPLGTFAGTLGGLLDTATGGLDGDWSLSGDAGICVGPWQASWAP